MAFVLQAFGLHQQYKASKQEARAQEENAARAKLASEAEAKQLETRARQGVAVGTYNSQLVARRAREIIAQQRARAAAGGGDTTDATVQAITDETVRNASMEQLLIGAEAEDAARQDKYAAKVARYTGASQARSYQAQAKAAKLGGQATLLSGTGDLLMNSWSKMYGG